MCHVVANYSLNNNKGLSLNDCSARMEGVKENPRAGNVRPEG